MLSQPPRAGFERLPQGMLNVAVEDMSIDAGVEIKHRILSAANKCAVSGARNNIEYATLLNAKTGEVIPGYELFPGNDRQVSIKSFIPVMESAEPGALALTHSHTNGTPFSPDDIRTFIKHKSLAEMFLASGGRLYHLKKLNIKVFDYDAIMKDLKQIRKTREFELDNLETYFSVLRTALSLHDILLERW